MSSRRFRSSVRGCQLLNLNVFARARCTCVSGNWRRGKQSSFGKTSLLLAGLLLSLLCLSAGRVSAQAVYGSIDGTVVDSSGATVANAKVTITDVNRNIVFNITTDGTGAFKQTHLINGKYRL